MEAARLQIPIEHGAQERMKTIATRAGSLVSRVMALDALRGLTVLGMIVVNTAGFLHDPEKLPAYGALLHSTWAGFTLADAVYPSFILIVGVSVAISLAATRIVGGEAREKAFGTIAARTARLLFVGFLISNLGWLQIPDDSHIRVFGVLQRIGLVYGVCAVLYLTTGSRLRLALAVAILAAYWPVTLLPTPDGPADLLAPGRNIVSWSERAMLGTHVYVPGRYGFDPEGLLSMLPAIAQGLIGVAVGEWIVGRGPGVATARGLAWAGAAVTLAGIAWCLVYPPIKALWTGSFVLISTGPTLIGLGLFYWVLDVRGARFPGRTVLLAFGANAITAYVMHEVGSIALEAGFFRQVYEAAAHVVSPEAAALLPVVIFTLMVWAPIAWFYRKHWIIRI
jgi:predicted acyltransferase